MNGLSVERKKNVIHPGGYTTALDGDSFDVIDTAKSPADQVADLLDYPDGETLSADALDALQALFAAIAADIRHRDPAKLLTRRIVCLGIVLGSLPLKLREAGEAFGISRQAILQTGQATLRRLAEVWGDDLLQHNPHASGPS